MSRRAWAGSSGLLVVVLGLGGGLATWKKSSLARAEAASSQQPEPRETVTVAVATRHTHARTTVSVGTVRALRSVTLKNELPGTVARIELTPGRIVEAGELLLRLDVSVEEAELAAREAQLALAESLLRRTERVAQSLAASAQDLDRARAERDVARANLDRVRAVIARKTIRAPFRARVGLTDVHPGQYLEAGTELTTIQGVEPAVHVDFTVAQDVAAGLSDGQRIGLDAQGGALRLEARVVAVDARIDPGTRNAWVRARVDDDAGHLAPGAAVRVHVPVGAPVEAAAIPVSALRKGPDGEHVFVVAPDPEGRPRARMRQVLSGPVLGDEVLILAGLGAGEWVAASGSFKLREAALVEIAARAPESTGTAAPTPER